MIEIVYSERLPAQKIMDKDKELLDSLKEGSLPILHFYTWNLPSVTFGYFIDPKKYLNLQNFKTLNIDLARRPTGGGVVFHLWDLAFSFIMPSSHDKFYESILDNYFFVNSVVLNFVNIFFHNNRKLEEKSNFFSSLKTERSDLGIFNKDTIFERKGKQSDFCMAGPTKYDVVVNEKKIAGAAQRRTKKGYLHQGSISLVFPDEMLLKNLLLNEDIISLIKQNSYPLLGNKKAISQKDLLKLRNLLAWCFKKSLC